MYPFNLLFLYSKAEWVRPVSADVIKADLLIITNTPVILSARPERKAICGAYFGSENKGFY